MSKPALALLLAAIAVVSFPRTSGATNYHEYKKFNLSGPSERELSSIGITTTAISGGSFCTTTNAMRNSCEKGTQT